MPIHTVAGAHPLHRVARTALVVDPLGGCKHPNARRGAVQPQVAVRRRGPVGPHHVQPVQGQIGRHIVKPIVMAPPPQVGK